MRGTEVSARAHGISIHLLSYLQDPTHPALTVELDRTRDARLNRARAIVELLAVDVPITWDDVLEHSRDAVVVGRPHIADALVALGIVPDRDAAFAHLLSRRRPVPRAPLRPRRRPTPCARSGRPAACPSSRTPAPTPAAGSCRTAVFDRLAAAGLGGIEVDHRDHSPAQRERLTAIADRLGLLVTGSSDYHGTGKANRLGENLTAPEVLAAIEEQGATDVVRP